MPGVPGIPGIAGAPPGIPGMPGAPDSPGKPGIGLPMGMVVPDTDTLTSIPSSPSPSSPSLLSCEEPGIGEPPLVEAVPCSLASAPDEELLDDLLELLDGSEAVDPGERGIEGMEADEDDEELGIEGMEADEDDEELGIDGEEEDEDEDELGIDGEEEDEDEDDDELGIEGMEEELELDWVDSQPASTKPSITALARALKGATAVNDRRGLLMDPPLTATLATQCE